MGVLPGERNQERHCTGERGHVAVRRQTGPGCARCQRRAYGKEQEEIKKAAEEKEKERDAKSAEADMLLRRHHVFANAVALFQVSIALGALAALTRVRLVWFGSLGLGAVGVGLFAWQFLM